MKIRLGIWLSLVLSAIVVPAGAGTNGRSVAPMTAAVSKVSDVLAIERAASGKLLAIGRLDSISRSESLAATLGQKFVLLASPAGSSFAERAEVGQAVAFFGNLVDGSYLVDSAMVLPGGYVQGASKVYLRATLTAVHHGVGAVNAGTIELDVASSSNQSKIAAATAGTVATFIGSQPAIGGRVLVERFARVRSKPRVELDASVGTGSPDASVGTGRPDASVGTGKPDASVGTGRPDASVGTGRPDASVGTGRPDASVGTGRPDASVGTGRPDASVGTGKPDASVGTGRPDASVGTGRPDASVGTGRPDASVGTGRPDASVGTGRPDASVGTGRPDASVGTGRPDASVGTGRPDASVGTGRP
ncbi:MAG: hypothetical protein ACREA9_24030, partial [Pyrinomonadaceae bacterium]